MRARGDRPVTARITWRVLGMFAYNDVRTGPGCSPKVWMDVGKLVGADRGDLEERAARAYRDAVITGTGVMRLEEDGGPGPNP